LWAAQYKADRHVTDIGAEKLIIWIFGQKERWATKKKRKVRKKRERGINHLAVTEEEMAKIQTSFNSSWGMRSGDLGYGCPKRP